MFIHDRDRHIYIDEERDAIVVSAGFRKDGIGQSFNLFWQDKIIPFVAELEVTVVEGEFARELCSTIVKIAGCDNLARLEKDYSGPAESVHYAFSSAEEERVTVALMKEALAAYRYPGTDVKCKVEPTKVLSSAWNFKENSEMLPIC